MKLQCGELRPILEGLNVILEKEFDDVKAAYWLGRAQAQIQTEFAPFEQARIKLVEKHAAKDGEGNLPKLEAGEAYDMEDMEAFITEYSDLANQEVEIKYNPIAIDRLAGMKDVKGSDIAKLGRLVKDDDDQEDSVVRIVPDE